MVFVAMQECLAAVLLQPVCSGVWIACQAGEQPFAVRDYDDLAGLCRCGQEPGQRIQQGWVETGFRFVEDEDFRFARCQQCGTQHDVAQGAVRQFAGP